MLAVLGAGCGEKGEPDVDSLPAEPVPAATTTTDAEQRPPAGERQPGGEAEEGGGVRPTSPDREASQTVEAYIEWIDVANGRALCTLLTDDALGQLDPPVRRPSCAASLSASIGYRDPRGAPVFEGVRLRGTDAKVDAGRARVRAAVSISFADRNRPSIEDDIVYLRRVAGEWRVAKPSVTLYRAIGTEPPLRAITPP